MNFVYLVVVFVVVATSVDGECVLSHEACTFVRSIIEKYQPLPDAGILKSVPEAVKKLLTPVTELTTQGALDCLDRFCSPDKKPNFCYVLYIPAYADDSRCKNILDLQSTSARYNFNAPPLYTTAIIYIWNESKRLENIIYNHDISAEDHCLNLQKFNQQRKSSNPPETEYVRVFNLSGQLSIAAHSIWPEIGPQIDTVKLYSTCIRSLLNEAATYFGVPSVITNDGEWLAKPDI